VRLQRDTIDRLQEFRGRHAVVTWDEAIDLLLQQGASETSGGGAPRVEERVFGRMDVGPASREHD
jgi:hypothetical protein